MAIRRLKDVIVAVCMLALGLLIAARLDQGHDGEVYGPFVAVDGDTLMGGGERIRLAGLDAPELSQRCSIDGREWPCGKVARDALSDILQLRPELVCQAEGHDRYGRRLARCRDADYDLGQALVSHGMALAYGRYSGEERQARIAGRGIWAGTFLRPDDFRRQHGDVDGGADWMLLMWNWLKAIMGGV